MASKSCNHQSMKTTSLKIWTKNMLRPTIETCQNSWLTIRYKTRQIRKQLKLAKDIVSKLATRRDMETTIATWQKSGKSSARADKSWLLCPWWMTGDINQKWLRVSIQSRAKVFNDIKALMMRAKVTSGCN